MESDEFAKIIVCTRVNPIKIHIPLDDKKEIFELNFVQYNVAEYKPKHNLNFWDIPAITTKTWDAKKDAKKKFRKQIEMASQRLSVKEMEDILREFRFKDLLL